MLQFYFLSVASLLLGGLSLLTGNTGNDARLSQRFLGARTVRYVIAAVAVISGVVKFFVQAPGETVPVAGDLLPALVGILVGLTLVGVSLAGRQAEGEEAQKAVRLTRLYKLPVGGVALAAGIAHFFVPFAVIV